MCEKYNGWANAFTWAVSLHDIVDDEAACDIVRRAYHDAYSPGNDWMGPNRDDLVRSYVADMLRDYVVELIYDMGDEPTNLFVLDMYQHALDMVDWYELSTHVLTQYASQASTTTAGGTQQ